MKENLKLVFFIPLVLPHIIFYLFSSRKRIINDDMKQWKTVRSYVDMHHKVWTLMKLLTYQKDFRTQFYFRIGLVRNFLQLFLSPIHDISFEGCNIGPGFVLIHGYGCVLNGSAIIGKNCTMLHGVTVGTIHGNDFPLIGDDVYVGAGALILGKVRVGNHVKIGAGAIVVEDVPDYATVVGNKARIICK